MSFLLWKRTTISLLLAGVCLVSVSRVFAQSDSDLRERALDGIERAQLFIVSQQAQDGTWSHGNNPTGATALVAMSLLYSGVKSSDPSIQKALKYLRGQPDPEKTYDVSLLIMLFSLIDDAQDRGRIRRLANWLIKAQRTQPENAGAWGYELSGGGWDNSNTQFAVLALREAVRSGVSIPRRVWQRAQDHWMRTRKGSPPAAVAWSYNAGDHRMTGSMTVAGIASLTITSEMLRDDKDVDRQGRIDCCAATQDDEVHATIEAALRWLGTPGNFSVRQNPRAGTPWYLYYMYGLERAGRFTGHRFIGNFDWYREGVRYLLSIQNPRNSSWYDAFTKSREHIGTALALLFLSKGNSPILINKLKYGDPKGAQYGRGWNRQPRDIANLTDYISTQPRWPKLMNWQVVDLDVAARHRDGAALLHAKVQYLSGDGPLDTITEEQVRLLRDYIDQGGFLFAVNTCGGQEFDQGIRELIKRIFPEPDLKLEKLPPTHDVYRSENIFEQSAGAPVPELWGVDIGCRTAVIYSPEDHACRWDKWMRLDPPGRLVSVKTQIGRSMRLGVNVVAYATGRELLDTLSEPERLTQDQNQITRGRLQIARLRHTGGWDTAPNALRHLQMALKTVGIEAAPTRASIPANDPNLFDYPMLYVHGRKNFRLTAEEQKGLKTYLNNGGFLFADACCGSKQFDESFRQLVESVTGKKLVPIPIEHELFHHALGYDIRRVRRRLPTPGRPGTPLQSEYSVGEPILEGLADEKGRYFLVYSKYDLSCALERQATVNCAGYASEDAAKIATNLVLYALYK